MRIVAVLAVVVIVSVMLACAGPGGTPSGPKPITRAEFKKLVEGKTKDEIRRALGPPNETSESGERITWKYFGRTYDPETGKVDSSVWFSFSSASGKAESLIF